MLSLIKIRDIHQYEDTDHVYAMVRTDPRATHVAREHHVGDPWFRPTDSINQTILSHVHRNLTMNVHLIKRCVEASRSKI